MAEEQPYSPIRDYMQEDRMRKRGMRNILVMSAAFFFLFASYNTLQGYVSTTLDKDNLGFKSLITLYVTYELFLIIAPWISANVGSDRLTMFFGAIGYGVFVASLIWGAEIPILIASVIIGIGAAMLWVAQGSYLVRNASKENLGELSGIFWGTFQLSALLGPMTSYVVLTEVSEGSRDRVMYITFMAFSVVAVFLLMFLRPPIVDADSAHESRRLQIQEQSKSLSSVLDPIISGTKLVMRNRNVALLLIPCLFTGFEMGFSNGEFFKLAGLWPCKLHSESEKVCLAHDCSWDSTQNQNPCTKDSQVISLVFAAFGIGDSIGGFVLGKVSDGGGLWRRKLVVFFGAICYALALALTFHIKRTDHDIKPVFPASLGMDRSVSWVCYVAAVLYGINDAAWNTQIFATFGEFVPRQTRVAFMIFQIMQQIGGILAFSLPLAIPLESSYVPIYIQCFTLFASTVTYLSLQSKAESRARNNDKSPFSDRSLLSEGEQH